MTQPNRRPRAKRPASGARTLETRLVKSAQCVTIHADGVWGGLTPQGQIAIGFFAEQFQVPDRVYYQVPETLPGSLKETERSGGGYVSREIQAQVFITPGMARSMIAWLTEKVEQWDAVSQEGSRLEESDTAVSTTMETDRE